MHQRGGQTADGELPVFVYVLVAYSLILLCTLRKEQDWLISVGRLSKMCIVISLLSLERIMDIAGLSNTGKLSSVETPASLCVSIYLFKAS